MPLYSDIRVLKSELSIDPANTQEDKLLSFFMVTASNWLEELLNRPGIFWKQRTEFYKGTGTQKLLLRSRPVYTTPTIQVFVDQGAYFGCAINSFDSTTSALTFGVDFALQIDQDDGSSRSAILWRMNDLWPRPQIRQQGYLAPFLTNDWGSVKVIYTAGYFVDNLPPIIREACNLIVARLRYVWPLGVELSSDSYEDRSIAVVNSEKSKLLALIKPMIYSFKNWNW